MAEPIELKWIVRGAAAFVSAILLIGHSPWIVHQIRKPIFDQSCEVGKKQDFILHNIGSTNLTAEADAELLAAVRVASGSSSIPIQNLRVKYNGRLIDLSEHPAWKRMMTPMVLQDSAAGIVIMHNLSYCNMREPWTLWPKNYKPQVFPVKVRTQEVEYAEAG